MIRITVTRRGKMWTATVRNQNEVILTRSMASLSGLMDVVKQAMLEVTSDV